MKRNLYILAAFILLMAQACSKFEEINTNPNATTQVSSEMLATTMLMSITRSEMSRQKSFVQPAILGKYMVWIEGEEGFQFNRLSNGSFSRITLLRNIDPMLKYAKDEGSKKSYKALSHFIRAWQFFYTSIQLGDIPYSEAVKGESEGIEFPKYDDQKSVFKGILNELDSAYTLFSSGSNFKGDPIYNGSTDKWKRLVNSFQLKVLINLYKKTSDADLNVINRFIDVASRPLMRNYADNFGLTFTDKSGQYYGYADIPAGSGNPFVKSNYSMLTNLLVETMKTNEDKRLFYFAKPAVSKMNAGGLKTDYSSYIGVEPSLPQDQLSAIRSSKAYSDLNFRYSQLANPEPVSMLAYWDQQFILAEAAVRGWITTETAQSYYAKGIQESMKMIQNLTPDNESFNNGVKLEAGYISSYPSDAKVALTGSTENQIKQIITQKYIANFMHGHNYDTWYENRRTGYPVFIVNPAQNKNDDPNALPLRWKYPSGEVSNNSDHLNEALNRQFNGIDDFNGVMWILK
ncbi:MAG: SusD/RagB family nutrient-binding outer membrane lipoprotein [Bacteroidia bacterium]|nr:MAG: SusD/RagB family nutrient-binding outer membrane lipoprotein [Bacteroidia bacterium]